MSAESLIQECNKALINSLPKEDTLYQYEGFWCPSMLIEGVINCQKHFEAKPSDVFLMSKPKSGTTWMKAILFALLNRKQHPLTQNMNHPLLTHNPHDLVPFIELLFAQYPVVPDDIASPRLLSAHMPYASLPESIKCDSYACKIVYICRNPKDCLVSYWHFLTELGLKEKEEFSMEVCFELFCRGVSLLGPYWDHVLDYWKQSRENPKKVFFLKYEDMKAEPGVCLRSLAAFLECPFSRDEEECGVVDEILKMCSFDHLKQLDVNTHQKGSTGIENKHFFRKGAVGDWENYLTAEMAEKIDQICRDKLFGSGLVL